MQVIGSFKYLRAFFPKFMGTTTFLSALRSSTRHPISSADCLMAISIISRFVICFSPFYQFSNLGMRRHVHFGNSVYHSLHPATQSFRFFSFRRSSARYLQNMKQHSRCPLHCCRINGGIIHDIRIFLLCRLRCVCVIAGERL